MQAYSDPKRENDPHALPDLEVWKVSEREIASGTFAELGLEEVGWYYWHCFPGCLPDSDPIGPFASSDEALADAREGAESDEDEEPITVCARCGQRWPCSVVNAPESHSPLEVALHVRVSS